MKRTIHRALRSAGLHLEKHRSVTADFAQAAQGAKCVLDGGAYHFTASREFLRLFPAAEVHAFEPNPALAKWFAPADRLHFHPVGLSDVTGNATFHVPKDAFTASLLTPGKEFGAAEEIEVAITAIDDLAFRPDALKLDLQGNELKALVGARQTLPHVKAVLCEVNFVARYDGCCLYHEVAAELANFGLNLFRFYEIHTDQSGRWRFADALFVR